MGQEDVSSKYMQSKPEDLSSHPPDPCQRLMSFFSDSECSDVYMCTLRHRCVHMYIRHKHYNTKKTLLFMFSFFKVMNKVI